MELISLIYGVYKLGRALMTGDDKGVETVAGDLVAAFLRPLLAGQDETIASLSRVEAALGQLSTQRFRQGMEVGWANLRDACTPGRAPADQQYFLRQALAEFRAAAATAPDLETRVQALLLVAACWAAAGSQSDMLHELERARQKTLEQVILDVRRYSQPGGALELFRSNEGSVGRFRRNVLGEATGNDHPGMVAARSELRRRARDDRDRAAGLHNELQSLRRAYGADPAGSTPIIGFYEPGETSISPRHVGAQLGGWVWYSNYPVFQWDRGSVLELDELRVDVLDDPVIKSRAGGGLELQTTLRVVAGSGEGVQMLAGPNWPYDFRKHGADGLSDIRGSKSIPGRMLTWNGGRLRLDGTRILHLTGRGTGSLTRLVVEQERVTIAGVDTALLGAMSL